LGGKSILYINYALVLGIEFVVIFLTIWIGVKQWRREINPLTTVLYRDAIAFSSILFVTSIANVALLAGTTSIALHLLLLEPQRILHSVLTSRIILHLRIASSDPQEIEMRPPTSFHHSDPSCNTGGTDVGTSTWGADQSPPGHFWCLAGCAVVVESAGVHRVE